MTEFIAVFAVAALSVVFGMLLRPRRSRGPCDAADDCASCSFSSESNHARN